MTKSNLEAQKQQRLLVQSSNKSEQTKTPHDCSKPTPILSQLLCKIYYPLKTATSGKFYIIPGSLCKTLKIYLSVRAAPANYPRRIYLHKSYSREKFNSP